MERPIEFDLTVEQHYRKHYNTLVTMMKQENVGEDIVQEAYTRALEQWYDFDPNIAEFSTWFGTKILPQARQYLLRQEARHGGINRVDWDALSEEERDQVIKDSHPPADAIGVYDEVARLLHQEKGRTRQILHMALIEGIPYNEIAEKVGVEKKAVRQAVWRFKGKFKNEERVL